MNTFANAIKNKTTTTRTENGDKTYSTSLNSNVDLFFKIAAIRGQDAKAVSLFGQAYKENPELATRIALWSRDVREGAGERGTFRTLLKHLEKTDKERLMRVMRLVPEIGRWDDLFVLETQAAKNLTISLFAEALKNGNGLAAKWMPREHNKKMRWLRDGVREAMGMTDKGHFRRTVTYLSNTVEQQMCENDWENIDFSKIPSVASARYSKAFWKRQPERYGTFVQKATKGEVKINASALFPYDVTKRGVDSLTKNALWNNLPDFVPEGVSFIPIVDVSGSMYCAINGGKGGGSVQCIDVSTSLGLYLAERNKTAFQGLAMTFSSNPQWIKVPKTDSVDDKLRAMYGGNQGYSTDLDKAMSLVLETAISNRVPRSEMPAYLLILSDMEFNQHGAGNTSVAERTRKKFHDANYPMPTLVWWNIHSKSDSTPVRYNENGMVLVSGCSPSITKSVLAGEANPEKAMLKTVMIERYNH